MTATAKNIVGVDIGGANLKYACIHGDALSTPFAMWRHPEKLAETLAADLPRLMPSTCAIDSLAVTMTGELADCFVDRAVGVDHIVTHACAAAQRLSIQEVAFYAVDGRFRLAEDARGNVDLVAAANWHALASLVAGEITEDAILIDIGSTTTDIIPLRPGRVATAAVTDHDRLVEGSLVYVGCRRTPVCALVDTLDFRGRTSRVMNEQFATIDDARLVLGIVPSEPDDCDTADGMPRTEDAAANRMARMIGLDRRTVTRDDAVHLATQVMAAARQQIRCALATFEPPPRIVLSGHGQDLVDLPANQNVMQLSDLFGWPSARCAPSYAVASLYAMQMGS